jgi:hypothetical protein
MLRKIVLWVGIPFLLASAAATGLGMTQDNQFIFIPSSIVLYTTFAVLTTLTMVKTMKELRKCIES